MRIATGAVRPRNDIVFCKECGTKPGGSSGRPTPTHRLSIELRRGRRPRRPVCTSPHICVGRRALTPPFSRKKTRGKPRFPPARTQKILLIRGHGLDDLDLTAIVGTALRAHSVRQMQRTALGACHQTGSRQLPNGAASLIASLLRYFSLRDCHVDTSLVF